MTLGIAALAVMTLWWPVTRNGLLGDDFEIARSVSTRGPLGMWCGDASGLFRPAASISAWIDSRLLVQASYAHVHSLVLYAAAAFAVGLLARGLRLEHPWLAAVVFLALGNHAEPVGWLAARADLLATSASVLALCACLSRRGRGSFWVYPLAMLALLSKESAIVLAPVAAVLLFSLGYAGQWAWRVFGVTVAWFVLRAAVLGEWVGGYGAEALPGFRWATIERIVESFAAAFGIYDERSGWVALGVACLVAAASGERRRSASLLAAFVITAVPTAGLEGTLAHGEGGRLVFIPSVFACLFVFSALSTFGRPVVSAIVMVVVLGVEAHQISSRLEPWIQAARIVERYESKLASLPTARDPVAVVAPGWLGPACVLCTGVDGAAWRLGRRSQVRAVALYRTDSPDCVPKVRTSGQRASVVLPACGTWVAPPESIEGLGVEFDDRVLDVRGRRPIWVETESEFASLLPPLVPE